jgi:hypothetical protein
VAVLVVVAVAGLAFRGGVMATASPAAVVGVRREVDKATPASSHIHRV